MESLLFVQKGYAERTCARYSEAVVLLTEAAELASAHTSLELEATAIEGAGLAHLDEGDHAAAEKLLQRNLVLARRIGDARRISQACLHAAKPAAPAAALALLSEE